MAELLWWMFSPSPFSIIFYLVLIGLGMKKLLKSVSYRKWKYINAFTESFFIIGFVIVLGDLQWITMSLIRFGSMFPQDVAQALLIVARNIAALVLCLLAVGNRIEWKNTTTFLVAVNILFLSAWFGFAPNPSLTDWTWAYSHDYPISIVSQAFFISHVIGKSIVALTWRTLW